MRNSQRNLEGDIMEVLFKRNPDIYKNAFPNWRRTIYSIYEFKTYSEMYKSSGDLLIDSIEENIGHQADEVIIPSIFMYRHSIELILKAILLSHYLMDENKSREKIQKKLDGHNLQTLWNRAENIIREYLNESIKNDKEPFDLMKTSIKELDLLDPTSMMFRYPFDKDYKEPQLIGDKEESFGIDYEELQHSFDNVYSFFLGCFHIIYDKYEGQDEIPIL